MNQLSIDDLFYKPVGAPDGGGAISPIRYQGLTKLRTFGKFDFRRDYLEIDHKHGDETVTTTIGGKQDGNKHTYEGDRLAKAKRIKIGYRTDDWKEGNETKKIDNEPVHKGVYRISPETNDNPDTDPVESQDATLYTYLQYTQFHIPVETAIPSKKRLVKTPTGKLRQVTCTNYIEFGLISFHGRTGARIDSLGVVLENQSAIEFGLVDSE